MISTHAFILPKDPINQAYLFANYSPVRALLVDAAPSFYVPNVPQYVANVGINADIATWNASASRPTLRHIYWP